MSVVTSDSLPELASPGKLAKKYPEYQAPQFCSEAETDCSEPGLTGVWDPISQACIPKSDDESFPTKLVVREPEEAFRVISQQGDKRARVQTPRAVPCYHAGKLQQWIDTQKEEGREVTFPTSRKPIGDEMQAEVRQRLIQRQRRPWKLMHTLTGHVGIIRTVSFSPSGLQIVSASDDKTVRVWNAMTGELVHELRGHENEVNSALFSPMLDDKRIVSASDDQTVRIWNFNEDGVTGYRLLRESTTVQSASFSPNGTRIVTACGNTVRVWNGASGIPFAERFTLTLSGHIAYVLSASFSPDGTQIFSAGSDGTVRVWNAGTGEEIRVLSLYGDLDNTSIHPRPLFSASFSRDGSQIVSAGFNKEVRVWNAVTGEILRILDTESKSASFSPNGTQIVSAGSDMTVRVWNATTGELIRRHGHSGPVYCAAFSPDGRKLASASKRLWGFALIFAAYDVHVWGAPAPGGEVD